MVLEFHFRKIISFTFCLCYCFRVPSYYPHLQWVAKRTQHIVVFMAKGLLQQNDIWPNQSVKKMGRVWKNPCTGFLCSLPPMRGHAKLLLLLLSPATKKFSNMCNVSAQGSLLRTQNPKALLRAFHIGTLCSAYTKILDSQKNSRCSP